MEQGGTRDARARMVGMVLLAAGVVLLLAVFALALRAFAGLPADLRASDAGTLEGAGRVVALAVARALLLFVMAYAGSLLASKGIEVFTVSSGQTLR